MLTAQQITEDLTSFEVSGKDDLFSVLRIEELAPNVFALMSDLYERGDMDGMQDGVTPADIPFFALALKNPEAYRNETGMEPNDAGNVDGFGKLDFDDIDDFAMKLNMSTTTLINIMSGLQNVPEPGSMCLIICFAVSQFLSRRTFCR